MAAAPVGPLAPFTAAPRIPAVGGAGGPLREVFGFALASSLTDPTVGYSTWDFSLLSTVAYFGLHVQGNGTFVFDTGSTVWSSAALSGLVSTAHARGTKVVLTIILQDFSPGTPTMCAGLANAATTIAATVQQVKEKGVDGVNIDYEGLNGSCGSADPSWAQHHMTSFAAAMRSSLPAGSYLSVDTYASSAIDSLGFFDIPSLATVVDSFFVMAYDLEYANYSRAPTSCSTFCLGPTAPLTGYYYNVTSTAAQYLSKVAASKVILGVPYYGRKACVGPGVPNAYPTSDVIADSYLDAVGESSYYLTAPGTFSAHRDPNDPAGLERWDTWLNTQLNCTRELYWDDAVSLAKKYELVNSSNLRGVGLWNLNYGGGAPELWSALNTAFACAVNVAVAAPTTTQFSVTVTAGSCAAASFDVQQYDSTLNQGWFPLGPAVPTGGTATVIAQGYPGHTYLFQARAHTTRGLLGAWSQNTSVVPAGATYSHPFKGLYTLDGFGGVQTSDSPPLAVSGYWRDWNIARAAHPQPGANSPQSGLVLEGWGGLHGYGAPFKSINVTAFWNGWDIARDFAWLPDGTGGYVLDGYGGLHSFSVNGAPLPPPAQGAGYWGGWDIARKVVIFADGKGGYVLEGFGGIHQFGIGTPATPGPVQTGYWSGWDIARDIVLIPGTRSGYVMEGLGGLHGFAPAGQPLPVPVTDNPYWPNWNIARGVFLLPTSTVTKPAGYILDGFGGPHQFGGAPVIARFAYWSGWDIAVGIFGA